MPLAHVTLRTAAFKLVTTTEADSAGRFALAYDGGGGGSVYVGFGGVGHERYEEEIYLDRPQAISLDARIAALVYTDSVTAVKAIGDFNNFKWSTARPLTRNADGTWTLDVATTADTVAYQLIGVGGRGGIPGTDAVRYAFRGPDDYAAVIPVHSGKATIVFRPELLPRSTPATQVLFHDRTSRTARVAEVLQSMSAHMETIMQGQRHPAPASETPTVAAMTRKAEWDPIAQTVIQQINTERDPVVRSVRLLELMQVAVFGATVPPIYGEKTLHEISPASPLWALPIVAQVGLVTQPVLVAGQKGVARPTLKDNPDLVPRFVAVTDAVLNAQHGEEARVYLMARAVGELTSVGKTDLANAYLSRLEGEYPDAEMTKSTMAQFGKSRVLRVGNIVPAFRLTAVADSAVTYTPETLKGKVYMIDFWATWCRPCVAQMPVLQKAYTDFRNRGFEILSVSADDSRETVNTFQNKRWKMPWLNAIAIEGLHSPEFRHFEISFLPRAVLVDKDGKIIAADGDLRDAELERTLTRGLATAVVR
ncbi:MAG: thioredoxin-like domain-containing protein [Gemmatimonadaceae bacterium]